MRIRVAHEDGTSIEVDSLVDSNPYDDGHLLTLATAQQIVDFWLHAYIDDEDDTLRQTKWIDGHGFVMVLYDQMALSVDLWESTTDHHPVADGPDLIVFSTDHSWPFAGTLTLSRV